MESPISMNTLMQSICSVQFNIKRHRELLESDQAHLLSEDEAADRGDTLMALMQATSELSTLYEQERAKCFPDYPGYDDLCERFVFP